MENELKELREVKERLYGMLYSMIDQGDHIMVGMFLANGMVDPNFPYEEDYPPLLAAIYSNENTWELVNTLIENGADVNYVNSRGQTPVLTAVEYDKTDALKLLLEKGAVVNYPNKNGRTPLALAKYLNHKECIRLLEEAKVETNGEDY